MTEIQGKSIFVRVSEGSSYLELTVFGKAGGTTGQKAGAYHGATFFFLGNQDPTTTFGRDQISKFHQHGRLETKGLFTWK